MPISLGAHNARIALARELLGKKGRREHGLFSFEGPTLLSEALEAGTPLEALYATASTYAATPLLAQIEQSGVPLYVIDERTMRKISGLETPSGIVAITPARLCRIEDIFDAPGIVLALADIGDPGNAGTLLRSAEAFGVRKVVFGDAGAQPHHPKVVRAAMGAIFRQRIALASPVQLAAAAAGWEITGLASGGRPLETLSRASKHLLLVGNERRGLGPWGLLCTRLGAIPMAGGAESLNAAVAGSIALYEATKRADS